MVEETIAIRSALIMAKEAGWTKIEVQSNCKKAIDNILESNGRECCITTILEDIEDLRLGFEHCYFSFVHRNRNKCSHMLAKFAVRVDRMGIQFPNVINRLCTEGYEGSCPFLYLTFV